MRKLALAVLSPATALFVSSVAVLHWIDFSIAGGLGHMRIPTELLWAHTLGAGLVLVVVHTVHGRASLSLGELVWCTLLGGVGAWSAFRNHPVLWQMAEDLECRAVDLCR